MEQVEQGDRLASACLAQYREMNGMSAAEDGREVRRDLANLVVADPAVEDLGQDGKLPLPRELLVVQVPRVDDDGVACGSVDLFTNDGLDNVLQLKLTFQ